MRPVDVLVIDGEANRRVSSLDEVLVDGRSIEIRPRDRAAVRIDTRVGPVDVLAIDSDPDDRVLVTGFDESLVHARAVERRPCDRPAGVVRPVDVAAADYDPSRRLRADDEASVRIEAAEVGSPDAASLILSAVRALRPEDEAARHPRATAACSQDSRDGHGRRRYAS